MHKDSREERHDIPGTASGMSPRARVFIHLVLLIVVCYFLFFFRMGARDLWKPDEPRYAQVSREMMETGEYVVPHLNGQVYTEKPPLYFWLTVLASMPSGEVSEVSARLPSALAATFVVLITYLFGAKALGRREAFLGAAITATCAQFIAIGRVGALDMPLTLSILGAMAAFYIAYADKRLWLYVAGFVFLIPGVLTKGPVAIAVPVVVMPAFLLMDVVLGREGSRKQFVWFVIFTVIGLGIIALVVGPWWQAAHERSGGVYGSLSILIKQTKGRMVDAFSKQQPFRFYFGEILWQFLPWTVFFPLAACAVHRRGNVREHTGLRFLLVWFLAILLFFTCLSGKRGQYLLPLFPAGGLILGWAMYSMEATRGRLKEHKEFAIPLLLLLLACAGGLVAAVFICEPPYLRIAAAGAALSLVLLVVLSVRLLTRSPATALAYVAGIMVLIVAVLSGYIGPAADKYRSARPFSNKVLAELAEGGGLYFYRFYRPAIHYYMRRHIPQLWSNEEIAGTLKQSPRVLLILQKQEEDNLREGAARYRYEVEDVERARVGNRYFVCLSVKPAEKLQ